MNKLNERLLQRMTSYILKSGETLDEKAVRNTVKHVFSTKKNHYGQRLFLIEEMAIEYHREYKMEVICFGCMHSYQIMKTGERTTDLCYLTNNEKQSIIYTVETIITADWYPTLLQQFYKNIAITVDYMNRLHGKNTVLG